MQDTSSKQQTKQKYKPNHQQTGLPPHSALPIRGKQNKTKLSTNLSLSEAYTNHWINFRRAETKRKKEFNLEAWGSESVKLLSCVQLFATPWTVAYQAPPSMTFSRQKYWSGLPLPSPGDLPDPGIESRYPVLQAEALPSEPPQIRLTV